MVDRRADLSGHWQETPPHLTPGPQAALKPAPKTSRYFTASNTKMKNVYQCDSTGILIGCDVAYDSPLEPGVLLIPAGCVTVPPPTIPSGMLARFSGEKWDLEIIPVETSVIAEGSAPTENPVAESPIELGRKAIAAILPPDLLSACQSYLSLIPDRNKTPLLKALFAWQLTVHITAQAGSSEFPSAPCSFQDVFNECVPQLQALLQL